MFSTARTIAPPAMLLLILVLVAGVSALPAATHAYTLTGDVTFEGLSQPPYPTVGVVLLEAGTQNPVGVALTDRTTGAYELTDVPEGSYEVLFMAPCWATVTMGAFPVFNDGTIETVNLYPAPSDFSSIRMVGAFNNWSLSAPEMSFDGNCTWSDTLTLQTGTYLFKFVTDGAFDNDYGGVQSTMLEIPGGPYTALPGVSGEGTAINIQAVVAGDYRFTLSEATQTWSAEYLGVIPQGSVSGTVWLLGLEEPPFPAATVELLESGTPTVLRTTTSDPITRAFTFGAVADGTYDVRAASRCFAADSKNAIEVAGTAVDIGEITLAGTVSPFISVHLVGEFTGWDIGSSPSMTQSQDCVWSTSILLTPGTYYFKFVTDGSFNNDYGGNESVILTAPGTYTVLPGVFGGNAIRMQFPAQDTYTFTLDESTLRFTVTGTVPVERTTWGSIKARY